MSFPLDLGIDLRLRTKCRVLEFFAGIGGMAQAWPEAEVLAALDINLKASEVYRQNFSHPYRICEIESLRIAELLDWKADMWWMSPPCQPFSRRGHRHDLTDARTRGLCHLIDALQVCRPPAIGLENVVGFENSQASCLLLERLNRCGYHAAMRQLCPSQFGWPNRRPRIYLLAALERLLPWQELPRLAVPLSDLVSQTQNIPELWLADRDVEVFQPAMDRVDSLDGQPVTACFSGSYGKTLLHAGSYLRCGPRYRRFSPREVARLLGFADSFRLAGLPPRTTWKLLGNSLSLPVVRYVLSHLP